MRRSAIFGKRSVEPASVETGIVSKPDTDCIGVFTADFSGRILDADENFLNMVGYTREDLFAVRWMDLTPADSLQSDHLALEEVARSGACRPYEKEYLHKDGSRVSAMVFASSVSGAAHRFRAFVLDVSEQRRAIRELRRSEQELADFFDNAAMGLHRVGPDGVILRVNQAELDLLGYSREEYVGHHIAEFHADQSVIEEILQRLRRSETLHNFPASLRCKDGTIKHVLIDSNVFQEDGEFVHARCFTRDITDQTRSEDALKESERKFRAVFDHALDAMLIADDEMNCRDANSAALLLIGVTKDRLLTSRIIDFAEPARHADVVEGWKEFLSRGEQSGVFRLVRPDGEIREIDYNAKAHIRPGRHLSVLRDITRQRRGERRLTAQYAVTAVLADSERLGDATPRILQSICESLGWEVGALWGVDPQARVLRCVEIWNQPRVSVPEFEAISRQRTFSPGVGLPGRVWTSGQAAWIPDVTVDPNFPRAQVAAKEGLHGAFGFPVLLGKEVLGVIEFFSHEIKPPDRDLLEMMASIGSQIGQFIERKRSEEERDRLFRAAQESDRRKDQFLAMLGHELRNPLGPIMNAVQVLDQTGEQSQLADRMRRVITKQTRHLARLVDDLLDVSRITLGKITLKLTPVDLNEIVRQCVGSFIDSEKIQRGVIQLALPGAPVFVEGDPVRLEQVIGNLLENAIKYSPEGTPIRVAVELGTGEAIVRVKDHGVGIKPELLPGIFELFNQAEPTLARTQGGLGVGLALVRTLVELHGGRITASSGGPGQGSEFVVCFPIGAAPAAPHTGPAPEVEAPRRVLIIEDNPDSREALRALLDLWGHHVEAAEDGPRGMEAASRARCDVALIDIGLPGMNGYEVARQLRASPEGKRMYLAALTGYGQPQDRQRALEAGFDTHLVKPVDPDELSRVISGIKSSF